MQNKAEQDRNQEATVYLGNLDERASDAMVWELMLQAGPVSNVFLPKDRISMSHQGFGFCEFMSEQDADYAVKIMNQIKLFGKPIRVNKASYDKKELAVGANLFVGSLDPSVDEQTLFDTFSTFGSISEHPKIARDPTTGESKGYAFVAYNDFESSDMAIENMNGQFFGGRQISVQYAFKKDGKGERHGSDAERLLAAQAKKNALLSGAGPTPYSFQGQFAGVLSTQTAPAPSMSAQSYAPPPPPGIPAYQPPAQQQQGYAQYPPQAQSYGQQQQQYGYTAAAGGQNGYGAPPPPPPGFGVNGMPQQQQQQQQYQAVPGQGGPPPPPIRMGFGGQ